MACLQDFFIVSPIFKMLTVEKKENCLCYIEYKDSGCENVRTTFYITYNVFEFYLLVWFSKSFTSLVVTVKSMIKNFLILSLNSKPL